MYTSSKMEYSNKEFVPTKYEIMSVVKDKAIKDADQKGRGS